MKLVNRILPTALIASLVAGALLLTSTPALANGAENNIFLPLVARDAEPVEVPVNAADVDFRIEQNWGMTRLQHIVENGGSYDGPYDNCGTGRKLEVYIVHSAFVGPFAVEVTHTDDAGNRWTEMGQISDKNGTSFPLYHHAVVRIIPNANHRTITSEPKHVWTDITQIHTDRLIASDYCTDEASCQQLVESNICGNNFSWNVVFTK